MPKGLCFLDFERLNLDKITGFEWDEGNLYKNEKKHGLHWSTIEEVFFNQPLLVVEDFRHSQKECRCLALGKDNRGNRLSVVFTVRNGKIRVISARPMSRKERKVYENA